MLEKKLVPKLRFAEFDGVWEEMKLSEVSKIERGRFSPRPRNNPIYYNGNIPFVQTSDVVNSNGKIINYTQTLNEKGLKVSKLFPKGTILITIAANIGYSGVLQIDMACPDSLIGIKCDKNTSNYFLNYLLKIEQPKLDYLAIDGAQKNINLEFLRPYPFYFPQLPEQQKIAFFLTEVDTKLSQLTKKKALLENYKKGVMQQIFSQEIRFKHNNSTKFGTREVSEFPDWEEKKLGSLCNKAQSGGTPKSTKKEFYNGDIPFLAISDMTYQGKYLTKTSKTISKLGLDNSSSWLVPKDSLIYSMYASVGFVSINKIEISTSQAVMNIMLKDSVLTEYMYYFLLDFKRYVSQFIETGTQGNINASIVKNFDIKVPSLKEQTKIANFLSELDSKIEVLSITIENTETFKKGLLQQMFV
jgi:type I restriction enzyme S subunit